VPALRAETRKAVTLPAELAKYTGTFEFSGQLSGAQLRVTFEDGWLRGYPHGDRPRAELAPESAAGKAIPLFGVNFRLRLRTKPVQGVILIS
jgi:hypothetical protein